MTVIQENGMRNNAMTAMDRVGGEITKIYKRENDRSNIMTAMDGVGGEITENK